MRGRILDSFADALDGKPATHTHTPSPGRSVRSGLALYTEPIILHQFLLVRGNFHTTCRSS